MHCHDYNKTEKSWSSVLRQATCSCAMQNGTNSVCLLVCIGMCSCNLFSPGQVHLRGEKVLCPAKSIRMQPHKAINIHRKWVVTLLLVLTEAGCGISSTATACQFHKRKHADQTGVSLGNYSTNEKKTHQKAAAMRWLSILQQVFTNQTAIVRCHWPIYGCWQ